MFKRDFIANNKWKKNETAYAELTQLAVLLRLE